MKPVIELSGDDYILNIRRIICAVEKTKKWQFVKRARLNNLLCDQVMQLFTMDLFDLTKIFYKYFFALPERIRAKLSTKEVGSGILFTINENNITIFYDAHSVFHVTDYGSMVDYEFSKSIPLMYHFRMSWEEHSRSIRKIITDDVVDSARLLVNGVK